MKLETNDCPGCSGEGAHEEVRRGPHGDPIHRAISCRQCRGAGRIEVCVVCGLPPAIEADAFLDSVARIFPAHFRVTLGGQS